MPGGPGPGHLPRVGPFAGGIGTFGVPGPPRMPIVRIAPAVGNDPVGPSRGCHREQAHRPDRRGTQPRHRGGPRSRLRDPLLRRCRSRAAAPGHRRRRRDPDPLGHEGRRRGDRRRSPPQGRRPRRRRPGQRRRPRSHAGRRDGRQRPHLQHRVRRRAGHRPAPGQRPAHRPGQRLAQGRCLEALQVHGRGARRQGGRRRRPGPDRHARGPAPERLRRQAHRLRPLRAAGARGPDGHPDGVASTSCWPTATSSRCTCPRPRRRSA